MCEVFRRTLAAAKTAAKPLLPTLIPLVMQIFESRQHSCCLDTIAAVVEHFGELKSTPEVAAQQEQALAVACSVSFELLNAHRSDLASHADLVAALYKLADRYLIFARDSFMACSALPALLQGAPACLALRDREPCSAVLSLVSHFYSTVERLSQDNSGSSAPACSAQVVQLGQQQSQELLRAVIFAACDTLPRQLLRTASGFVYGQLNSKLYGSGAVHSVTSALQTPLFPGTVSGLVASEDIDSMLRLVFRQPPLQLGKFDALWMDFAGLAKGEATSDVLLAYQI